MAAPESLKIPLAMLIVTATARFLDEVIGPSELNGLQPTDASPHLRNWASTSYCFASGWR